MILCVYLCVIRDFTVAFCTCLHFRACICGPQWPTCAWACHRTLSFVMFVWWCALSAWWRALWLHLERRTMTHVTKCSKCFKCSQMFPVWLGSTAANLGTSHCNVETKWNEYVSAKRSSLLTQHLRSRAFNPNLKLTVLPLFSRPLRKPRLRAVWECRSTSRWIVTLVCPCLSWWWRRPKTGQSPGEIVGTPSFEIVKIHGDPWRVRVVFCDEVPNLKRHV